MKALLVLLLAGVVAGTVAIVAWHRRRAGRTDEAWPYYARKALGAAELLVYQRLVQALPGCIVLAQVQVSRVLGVRQGADPHRWSNRVNRLAYDFLVCAKDAGIMAAIELDDGVHDTPRRREAASKKAQASAAAGVRLLHWHARQLPDEAAMREAVGWLPPRPGISPPA